MQFTSGAIMLLALGCATTPTLTTASVDAAATKYGEAAKTATPAEIAAFYTDDGELQLPGTQALHGPAAIRDFLAPMAATIVVDACTMESDMTSVDGTHATQFGHYNQTAGERGKEHTHYTGRYAALWRWEEGRWRIVRLMMQPGK